MRNVLLVCVGMCLLPVVGLRSEMKFFFCPREKWLRMGGEILNYPIKQDANPYSDGRLKL